MTDKISRSQIRTLTQGLDEGTAAMIELVAREINRAEEDIRRGLQILQGRIENVTSRIDAGYHCEEQLANPASQIEAAIARRTQAWQMMTGLVGPETCGDLTRGQ